MGHARSDAHRSDGGVMVFRDREEAGRLLAAKLESYRDDPNGLILALPRGGVAVGYELSLALDVPVSYFFEGAPSDSKAKIQGFAEDAGVFSHESTVDKREALELLRLYNAVPAGASRRKVLVAVRTIASAVGDFALSRAGRPKGSKNKKVVKLAGKTVGKATAKPAAKKTAAKRGRPAKAK